MSRVSGRSVLILLTYQVILRNFEKKSNQIYLAAQNNPNIYIYIQKKTIPWEKFIISVAVKDFFTQFIVFTQEDSAYAANFVTIFAIV